MQKEIFFDQAGQHEAFLHGGTAEINRLERAKVIDSDTRDAWGALESGMTDQHSSNPTLANQARQDISKANGQLLYREQNQIINDEYDEMRGHPVTGEAFTYAFSLVGQPSIPGAQSLPEYAPLYVGTPFPGIEARLSEGNIADQDTRWDLITNDTLPAYQDLLQNDPERAREIIGSDFNQRMEEQRFLNRLGPITDDLIWHIGEPR